MTSIRVEAVTMHNPNVSLGEAGGVFAGIVAVLGLLGAGAKWLLNWNDARANSRSAKLQAWHDELEAREQKLNAEFERRFETVERNYRGVSASHAELLLKFERMRMAYRIIAAALIDVSPHSAALVQAAAILNEPLPVPTAPEDAAAIAAIETKAKD